MMLSRLADDSHFFILGQITQLYFEHEPVKLSLRQRVGAFKFNGILCRKHKKRLRHGVRHPGRGNLTLLHSFKQRRLSLGWRPVDFVSQQNIGEYRPFHKLELSATVGLFHKL